MNPPLSHTPFAGVVGIIDDDAGMVRALCRLLQTAGFRCEPFSSAGEFLGAARARRVDCLVLDVCMPGVSGLELQDRLNENHAALPVIFLTGQGDIPMTVRAMRAGAVNFLTKPVEDEKLIAAVRTALAQASRRRVREKALADQRARLDTLTPREHQVLRHVISGQLNKQIAADLGISEQTVKVHRMRITEKMNIFSVADLVRTAERLGVTPPPGPPS